MHLFFRQLYSVKSEICLSRIKSESVVIPRSFSCELEVMHVLLRCTSIEFFVLNRMTFVWINFCMIIGKPRKKFICCWLQLLNYVRYVIRTKIWSCIINISSHSKKKSIKSMLNSNGLKIEPCGTLYSILLLSL